jgi:hypothetical protein
MNEDGSMARVHGLITIADLISYRMRTEARPSRHLLAPNGAGSVYGVRLQPDRRPVAMALVRGELVM